MYLRRVTLPEYQAALRFARDCDERVREYTSHENTFGDDGRYFLTDDGLSGFGVSGEGEMVGLFSLVRGRGSWLAFRAEAHGATRLDCFDGYLPRFYASLGWREYHREPNWTPGGPDVVYMTVAEVTA